MAARLTSEPPGARGRQYKLCNQSVQLERTNCATRPERERDHGAPASVDASRRRHAAYVRRARSCARLVTSVSFDAAEVAAMAAGWRRSPPTAAWGTEQGVSPGASFHTHDRRRAPAFDPARGHRPRPRRGAPGSEPAHDDALPAIHAVIAGCAAHVLPTLASFLDHRRWTLDVNDPS
jgi:hypothetical protein